MGKKLSEEVIESDSDESMQDAPVNEKKDAEVSSNEESTNSSSESESSDESSSETQNNNTTPSSSNRKKAFVPPSGFRPSKMKSQPSAAISSVLSNLEGKQVFHITAPSYLPLSEIKQIDFGKATSGESILSHKGVDYGLVENSRQQKQGSETLLVYDEKTNTFLRKPELRKIESYNIQEIVRLPGLDTLVPSSIAQDATNKQAGARPQPKHLRMRFHPVGSSNLPPETVGSSSESEADQPPTSHGPSTSSKEKDRKRKTAEQQNGTEEKAKKSKKEKQQLSAQVEAESEGRRDKEKKKSSKHRDETSQERRARKEEKKKRKAEKEK